MTANLFIHEYYYRYRQYRKQIKDIVDNQNYIDARNQLNAAIAEQQTKFPDMDTRRDFNFGEKIMMVHAKNHLDTVIEDNDPPFLNYKTGTIEHNSDTVKSALLRVPKSDYSDD